MALVNSMEKNGNWLFRYRGQIPVLLFLLSIPAIWFTNYDWIEFDEDKQFLWLIIAASISALGQIIRAIAIGTSNKHTSGRNTKEQVAEALNTKGIYSTVRHPLYLGNYLMWIGIVIYVLNPWFVLVVSLLFWLYYERIMFAEERFLERKFGEQYLSWSNTIPAFIPSFKRYEKSPIPFSLKTILRREYSGVTATIIGFLFVAIIRDYKLNGGFENNNMYWIVLSVALFISLFFRTLKHNTKVLHEDDRS
jgi:protein-S-isoprenylcysteine O-methyltransferase Ste14